MRSHPADAAPVPYGPVAYRRQLRTFGALAALAPPAALGVFALLALHWGSSTAGVLGFASALFAAPGLLVAGAPLATGGTVYTLATLASAAVWMALGAIAARRATRRPAADWRDFWREYLWLAAGVWIGVIGAVLAADVLLGQAFL
ncbi:MAG: hypothetical protein F2681_05270 [Actinobacteria bacterium]|nr:hypothetical protein [Actinomycetota bacterium]MSW77541.1 hypothetical protein [Actinomycetota bacterium]MSX56932.1 hypothetical protein [Actinomycetota bacterium]MSX93019.1 hypothetical protein [Actinomycetota bacterium]MSZ82535.1 hypothetical protein [Actinomycetota bacterium]